MAKKLLAFLLTFALLLSSVTTAAVFTASAEVDAWDGSIATAFAGGSGTKDDPYQISNGAELAYMFNAVNVTTGSSFSNGKYFKLTADIYLNDVTKDDWKENNPNPWYVSVSTNGYRFTGNFDGAGHTVYGMYYSGESGNVGLLPVMDTWNQDTVVKDLTISDSYISTSGNIIGAVSARLYSDNKRTAHFYNINVKDSVTIESSNKDAYVGGILGFSNCNANSYYQFSGCVVLADISSDHALIGYGTNATVAKVVQSYTTASDWYPTNSTTSATAYLISDASAIKGKEAAMEAMPGLDWLRIWNCSATGYPYPMSYNTNNVAGRVWNGFLAATYAGGSGTAEDPYIIETAEQLARMVKFSGRENGYYKIVKDIYLNDVSKADWATNSPNKWFDRAAINNTAFVGNIDGTGHTVYGLYYNGGSIFGLLPQASESSIANLRISNSDITSTGAIAALVGFGQVKVSFSKCMVDETVKITGSGDTAGFVAYGTPSVYIDSSASTANITGATNVGAFIGDCWYGTSTASDGSTVYTKHVINNSYGIDHPLDAKLGYTSSNCYNTVAETQSFTAGEVVNLGDKALMQGADALKNMPELDFFGTTATYPVIYQQGTKGAVWSGSVATDYAAGSGTKADPYIIETAEQLVKLVHDANTAGKYYEITADIKLNDTAAEDWTATAKQWFAYNAASEFPGTFAGTLNGAGNTISGLYYNGDKFYVGLFVSSMNAAFNDIVVSESVLTSSNTGGSVSVFTGYVGGAINYSGCVVDDSVSVTGAHASGFGSYGSGNITVTNSISVAGVSGTKYAGAFFADVWSSTLKVSNSIGLAQFSPRRSYTGSNNYGTVEDAYGVNVVTADQMQGADALENMPKLSGYFATASYPTRYNNGTAGAVWSGAVASDFASGSGTVEDPYVIETAEQFARMLKVASKGNNYVLGADVILGNTSVANKWFDSSNSNVFAGHFDGNGYIVSGLEYTDTATGVKYVGLIPTANGAYIKNVILEDASFNMTSNCIDATYVGGIVGYITGKTNIYSCYVADSVTLTNKVADGVETIKTVVGGILGGGSAPFEIDGCSFFGTIDSSNYRYGAVFGDVWSGTTADRIIKNTMVDKYTPSSRWGFKGINNVSTVAPSGTTDENGSFTVLESVKGEDAVKIANWNDRYFATENYPVLSLLGARFSDVDGDRDCNAEDLVALRKKLLGITTLGFADINGDGTKNVKDLVSLKKKCTELSGAYRLVWSDEFDGASLDETKWNTAQTRMADTTELAQSSLGSVRTVADGKLQLNAKVNPFYSAASETYFEQHKYITTGSITTEKKMSYQYGYLEVSAKLPYKEGCWPSLWLRSHNSTGKQENPNFEVEVDVFEVFGNKIAMASNLHQQQYNGLSYNTNTSEINEAEVHTFADASNLVNEYHTYGFEWTPEKMAVYVDGVLQCEWLLDAESLESYGLKPDASGFDTTLNILINNHLFTNSSAYKPSNNNIIENYESNLPAEYDIEYVRLYQKNDGLSRLILGE
ncbi:MAG: glycosyl hydrolase family protein [Ruminococcaceae bacterium]|nr:glycosyl hydrolase family protein [Oscillospiraceae bacterium]